MAKIEIYLEKFASWLYQAKHDPDFAALIDDKKLKRTVEANPKTLSVELTDFIDILVSNADRLKKLAKQCKKKLVELNNHIDSVFQGKELPHIRQFQEIVLKSLEQITEILKKIKESKHRVTTETEQNSPPIHLVGKEESFEMRKAANKTTPTHLNISPIVRKKTSPGKTRGF